MASFPTPYLPAIPLSSPPSLLGPLPSPSLSSASSEEGGASFPFLGLSPLSAFPPSPVSVGSSFNPYSPPPISRTHATSGGGIPYSLSGIAGPGLPCSPSHPTTPFLLHSGRVGRTLRREDGARHHPYQQQGSSGLRALSSSPGVHGRRRHGRGGDREASRSRRQSVEGEGQETDRSGYASVNNVSDTAISPPFLASDQDKTQGEITATPSGSSSKRRRESSLSAILDRIGLSCCESPGNFITPRCEQLPDTQVDTPLEGNIHHKNAPMKVLPSQDLQVPSLVSPPSFPSDGCSVEVLKITSSWCLTGAPSSSRRRTLSVDRIYVPPSPSQDNRGDLVSSSTPHHQMTFFNGKDGTSPVLQQPFTHLQRTESRGGGSADPYRRRAYSLSGREVFHVAPSSSFLNNSGESQGSHPLMTANAFQQPGGFDRSIPGVADVAPDTNNSPSFFVSPSVDVSPTERGRTRERKGVRDDPAGRHTRACSLWACCCAEGQEGFFLDTSRTAGSLRGGEVYRGRPLTRGDVVEKGGRFASVRGVDDYSSPQIAYPFGSSSSTQFRTMSERRWDDGAVGKNGERAPGGIGLRGGGGSSRRILWSFPRA